MAHNRYGSKNKLGKRFYGPHRNPEVNQLLDEGFAAFWVPIKHADSRETLHEYETSYLHKVWKGDELQYRPKWLLNRTKESLGNLPGVKRGPNHKISGDNHYTRRPEWDPNTHWTRDKNNHEKLEKVLQAAGSRESIAKRKQTRQQTQSNLNYMSPLTGKKRPDHSEKMKLKVPCPVCGLLSNAGGLATHIRWKHQ